VRRIADIPVVAGCPRAVVDAIADLSEKLVPGTSNPDHFAVDSTRYSTA
jgi:hypothetical protein